MKRPFRTYALISASLLAIGGPALAAPHHDQDDKGRGAGPPGVAAMPPGVPPGLAKKPGGLPPGQAKKIWSRGERLPVTYLQPRYYILKPTVYRLPPAPAGYRWTLVDDRAYLVQPQSGTISQVIQIAAALLSR